MAVPQAFEIGRSTATNINQSIRRGKDLTALDEILNRASQSNDPNELNNSISQLLTQVSQERQGPALQFIQQRKQQLDQQNQSELFSKAQSGQATDEELQRLSPNLQVELSKARNKPPPSPGVKDTARLKTLAHSAETVEDSIVDATRALELLPNTTTGPIVGIPGELGLRSNNQQELQGIASRLLTRGFKVLPRIANEFESFKGGQLSLKNSEATNRRVVENQLAGYLLEREVINRFDELRQQNPTVGEGILLNRAEQEFKGQAKELLKQFKETQSIIDAEQKGGQGTTPSGITQEQVTAGMFGA